MVTSKYKKWFDKKSTVAKVKFAKAAGSSISTLYQLYNGDRNATSELAARLEKASEGGIHRGDICAACRKCQYLKEFENE